MGVDGEWWFCVIVRIVDHWWFVRCSIVDRTVFCAMFNPAVCCASCVP